MKTIKQIADELGVDKQKIYRIIKKNHINEAVQEGQVKRYDEAVITLVKSELSYEEPHQNHINEPLQKHINETVSEAVVSLLQKELEAKNRQISEQLEIFTKQLAEKDKQIAELTATVKIHAESIKADNQTALLMEGKNLIESNTDSQMQPQKKSFLSRLFGK